MTSATPRAPMRIGELARRTGVSEHALRVWERRYGLLEPARSPSGYRLYSTRDEDRVHAVARLRQEGVTAAEAVVRVLSAERSRSEGPSALDSDADDLRSPADIVAALHEAVHHFDEAAAHSLLDRAFTTLEPEQLVTQVLLPYLRELGCRWEDGLATIAHEHFASSLIRRRLSPHTLTWGQGTGPLALLACPPAEWHDLGLQLFGVLLARAGWRVRFLGPNTPIATIVGDASVGVDVVVLSAVVPDSLTRYADTLAALAARQRLVLGGAGATPEVCSRIGAECLSSDMIRAVRDLTVGVAV